MSMILALTNPSRAKMTPAASSSLLRVLRPRSVTGWSRWLSSTSASDVVPRRGPIREMMASTTWRADEAQRHLAVGLGHRVDAQRPALPVPGGHADAHLQEGERGEL